MKRTLFVIAAVCLGSFGTLIVLHHAPSVGSAAARLQTTTDSRLAVLDAYGKLPMAFEANAGQTDGQVKFLARGAGYTVFLTEQNATLRLEPLSSKLETAGNSGKNAVRSGAVVRFALSNSNPRSAVHGLNVEPGHANYFVGNDPRRWRKNVPQFSRVQFDDVYPGIDLVYYGSQGQLESDYVVSPGADAKRVALHVEGADHVRLNSAGDAILSTAAGEVSLHEPRAYQEVGGERREIAANYVPSATRTLSIRVGPYDHQLPLVIDPIVGYATLLSGSTSGTIGNAIATDPSGNAYVVGSTGATDFPVTSGAFQTASNNPTTGNAFVTKFNSTGTALIFSTYLGGSGQTGRFDNATAVAVDGSGDVYVAGSTPSTDFPTLAATAYQVVNNGTPLNGFLTKLDPTGATLLYSTYLGGSGDDSCAGIAVDANQNAYLTGSATSTNFPVTPATAIQSSGQSTGLAFVSRIDTTRSGTGSLIYSTLLGGTKANQGTAIAVDTSFSAYVTGQTTSTDFPTTTSAFQSALKGTAGNAFVARVDTTTANNLEYSTYLGGTATTAGTGDIGVGIALDPSFNVYVTGNTRTSDFPITSGVLQTASKNTNKTTFVSRLDTTKSNGASLTYSTYLGGSTQDTATAIAVDGNGNAYVTGSTQSADFPTTPGAPQFTRTTLNRNLAYVSVLSPTATTLSFSTYFGGTTGDFATGIALDSATSPNVYITGGTTSPDFPATIGAFQTIFKTAGAFVAKLTPSAATGVLLSPVSIDFGNVVVGSPSQPRVVTLANLTPAALLITNVSFTGTNGTDFTKGSTTCVGTIAIGATCTINVIFTPSTTGIETATLSVSDTDASTPQTVPLIGAGTPPPSPVFLTPATTNFGNQGMGTTSTPQTVTLVNNSKVTVTGIVVSITGGSVSSFAQTNTCAATLAAGASCPISVKFTPAATGNVTATLSVADSDASSPQTATLSGVGTTTSPDFTIAASPTTASVAAGSPTNITVTVVGLNSFTNSVALTCSGAPVDSTCTLTPTSVTPTPTGATSSATITTAARTTPAMSLRIDSRPPSGMWTAALGLSLFGFVSFAWWTRRIPATKKLAWTFAALMALSLTSCSGLPATGTPAGTYTITVTGTSGMLTHTATVTLTVS